MGLQGRVSAREREMGFWVFEVNEIERYNIFGKNEKPKKKKKKKTEGRFGERRGFRRSIVAVQPVAITKKNRCYSSHIAAFFA